MQFHAPWVLLAALSIPISDAPAPAGEVTIKISAETASRCLNDGGCAYITQNDVLELMKKAYAEGAKQEKLACPRLL